MNTVDLIEIGLASVIFGIFLFFENKYTIIKTMIHVLVVFIIFTIFNILFNFFGAREFLDSITKPLKNDLIGMVVIFSSLIGITGYLVYKTFRKK
ncbi:hypothetical protein [Chengkuizengella axinellae]|uniref:Uncharacterized protein n=1 Tax=Chengkuizengella axinellae TaxID=3064388 RepID=A0ABT9IXR3_9BACL|nr:hypothetical protein [Chengkuizengella sp. 2205SS18-9]MDP5273585.1 hypothetical protein [Chengkuizengella sp. 2205SS18-9]